MTTPGTAQSSNDDTRIVGIELLRFASALAVLVFHYQHFSFVGTQEVRFIASAQPFYSVLRLFYQNGFYGVQVFWCISGFIFFWKYGTRIATHRIDGYTFLILRLSRLYPLHFLTLLFVAAAQLVYSAKMHVYFVYAANDLYHFVLQLFMASNWASQTPESFNGPIWSISVEVLVYALFFLSLRYISASMANLVVTAATCALIQVLKLSEHPVFNCLTFFYLGCITAAIYLRVRNAPRQRLLASVAALAAIVGVLVLGTHWHMTPKFMLIVLSPALIFLCVTHVRATPLSSRLLVPAGNMTYSSYLLHVPLQITVVTFCAYTGRVIPFYSGWFFVGYLVLILLLSIGSYKYIEMPLQTLLRTRLMRRTAVVAPAHP
jgi:peptidoglycan/LPS O-acetylase OafA/YrhL